MDASEKIPDSLNTIKEKILAEPRFEWGRFRWALNAVFPSCQPGDRVLDIGCGKGWLMDAFGRVGLVTHGVDVDPQAVEDSKMFCPDATINLFDGVQLPYPDNYFEYATFIEVLEHVGNESALLNEIRRVLTRGGILALTTPHTGPWTFLDPDNFKFRVPWAHKFLYQALGRSEEYNRRFGRQDGTLFGNFTKITSDNSLWHRHYTQEQVEKLAPGFEILACRREGGLLFALALIANYITEKLTGSWAAPFTSLMKWDAREDRGKRGWSMQMILRRKD